MLNTQIVANTILMLSFKENILITPMKLQKLMYFIYKEYLQDTGNKLFSESFEKWQYGPVLPSIYYEFKSFGSGFITKFARDAKGEVEVISIDSETYISKIIKRVWNKCKNYRAYELSELTHQKGSAWDKAEDFILKDEDIKNEQKFL